MLLGLFKFEYCTLLYSLGYKHGLAQCLICKIKGTYQHKCRGQTTFRLEHKKRDGRIIWYLMVVTCNRNNFRLISSLITVSKY